MSATIKRTRDFGWKVASEIDTLIRSACHRVEVAGSLRRGLPFVHDVDLVIHARYDELHTQDLFGVVTVECTPSILIRALMGIVVFGPNARIIRFAHRGMPVDIYLAEPDGSNVEALLQMRTGSAEHNRNLAARAQSLGLSYRAGYGIFRGDARVDDGTEGGIYRALGLVVPRPADRSF